MRQRRLMNQINVVPYIDVMLVLLVIFMVTAPMIPNATVDLPSVAKAAQAPVPPIVITVKGENRWSVEDRQTRKSASPVKETDLLKDVTDMQGTNPDKPVVIAADKSVRYEAVMKVMDLLKRNNINKVGLLVQQGS